MRDREMLGLLPEDELLHSITVRTLADELHGECIACKEHLDRFVTHPLIGAMTQEGTMRYLKRVRDSATITGGEQGAPRRRARAHQRGLRPPYQEARAPAQTHSVKVKIDDGPGIFT